MLLREKDQLLAVKEAEEKLIADFLEADGNNKNFHDKDMMEAIVALRSHYGGDSNNGGGFDGVLGKKRRKTQRKSMFSKPNRLN